MSQFRFAIDEFVEHRNEREFIFPLIASSIGRKTRFEARARRLSIMDRASLGFLPQNLQEEVWQRLKTTQKAIEEHATEDPKSLTEALSNIDGQVEMGNIFVEYGFIEPKIVTKKADEDLSKGILHVDRIDMHDRIDYMVACTDHRSEQATRFETFRHEPEPVVPSGDDGEVPTDSPIRFDRDTPPTY